MFEQQEIDERIKEVIAESLLNDIKFANKASIDQSSFNKKIRGISPWTISDINKICTAFNVRKGWLIDGEGQKFKAPDEILDTIPAVPKENAPLLNAVDLFTDQTLRMEKFIDMLSNEISEVRAIKEELQKQKEENKKLQELLHDAIFSLRSTSNNENTQHIMEADK